MNITTKQLAKALDHTWVYAANRDGTHHAQIVNPDEVARDLWEKLGDATGDNNLADALDKALRNAHSDEDGFMVAGTRADKILGTVISTLAMHGYRDPMATRAEPEAINVHDRELHALATIADQLTSLDNPNAVSRILRYFCDRYGDGDD